MTNPQDITVDDLAREFFEVIPDEDIGVSKMFGKLALGTAKAMHAQSDDDFDWIRHDPLGGVAYQAAVWEFLARIWEAGNQERYQLDMEDEALDIVGTLTLAFAEITFGAYNKMSGGDDITTLLENEPTPTEKKIIAERIVHFYGTYLQPQFKLLMSS